MSGPGILPGASVQWITDTLTSSATQVMATGDIINTGDPTTHASIGQIAVTIQGQRAIPTASNLGEVYWSSDGGTTPLPVANVPAGAFLYAGADWATFAARTSWGSPFGFLLLDYIA